MNIIARKKMRVVCEIDQILVAAYGLARIFGFLTMLLVYFVVVIFIQYPFDNSTLLYRQDKVDIRYSAHTIPIPIPKFKLGDISDFDRLIRQL